MVEVSNVQAQRQVRCELMQHVQQAQQVRTAGDAYDYGVSRIDQLVALNGVLHFGYQGHWEIIPHALTKRRGEPRHHKSAALQVALSTPSRQLKRIRRISQKAV